MQLKCYTNNFFPIKDQKRKKKLHYYIHILEKQCTLQLIYINVYREHPFYTKRHIVNWNRYISRDIQEQFKYFEDSPAIVPTQDCMKTRLWLQALNSMAHIALFSPILYKNLFYLGINQWQQFGLFSELLCEKSAQTAKRLFYNNYSKKANKALQLA